MSADLVFEKINTKIINQLEPTYGFSEINDALDCIIFFDGETSAWTANGNLTSIRACVNTMLSDNVIVFRDNNSIHTIVL